MPNYKYEDSTTRARKLVAKLIKEAEIRGLNTGARLAAEHECGYNCYSEVDGHHTGHCKYDILRTIEVKVSQIK